MAFRSRGQERRRLVVVVADIQDRRVFIHRVLGRAQEPLRALERGLGCEGEVHRGGGMADDDHVAERKNLHGGGESV